VAIFRPAVVSNSVKEPVAGWVDAAHGTAGTLLAIAHGVLKNAWAGPSSPLYLVPVDFCASLMLAIGWEVGTAGHQRYRQAGLLCTPQNIAQSSEF
jgi:fatty acyl-CoA reductase